MNSQSAALDKLEIMELAHRFENAFDAGDIDGHMETWIDDLQFESPFGNYNTRADYLEWVTNFSSQMQQQGGTRHLINNHDIHVNGDTATMTCYLTILMRDGRNIMATTQFNDELRRVDGAWKFARRQLEVDQDMSALQS